VLSWGEWDPQLVAALARATDGAARAAAAWFGRGDKDAADRAAVAAMRAELAEAPFDGTVVIGEGEKDAAPMLANGERLGGGGIACDIAVDPLDGTRLVAEGLTGSIAVIALSPAGSMFDPVDAFYMDKLIAGPKGRGVLDIRRSPAGNVLAYADATGVQPREVSVAVLDKPRHAGLIGELRATGAAVRLVGEGDVSVAVAAASGDPDIDLVLGIGGTPEGIVAACAVRALGGFLQGRLAPQSNEQLAQVIAAGHDVGRILELDDLVRSDQVLFVSSSVRSRSSS
jgi:fructose-1,6-bisphosphatase II